MKNPLQPLITDTCGVVRFKGNAIVRHLLDTHQTTGMNQLVKLNFDADDWRQFAQLLGYSLNGYGELSYVSAHDYAVAAAMAKSNTSVSGEVDAFLDLLAPAGAGYALVPMVMTQHQEDAAARELTACGEDYSDPELRGYVRAAYAAAVSAGSQPAPAQAVPSDAWRHAVLDFAAEYHADGSEPREMLRNIIAAAVAIATDPALSGSSEAGPSDEEIGDLWAEACDGWTMPRLDGGVLPIDRFARALLARYGSRAGAVPDERDALTAVREAITDYHLALDKRSNDDTTVSPRLATFYHAIKAVETALGMPWVPGEALGACKPSEGAAP